MTRLAPGRGISFVPRAGAKDSRMDDCPFQPRVEAYHDNELDPADRRAVELHLARCAACAAELHWLRSVSGALSIRPDALAPAALTRIHDAVDEAADADESDEADAYPISLYRTAAALTAVAASILVLGVVWLNELPPPGTTPGPGAVTMAGEVPAWERVAINLRADPMPIDPVGEVYLADARLAEWMLEGLAGKAPNPGRATDENR